MIENGLCQQSKHSKKLSAVSKVAEIRFFQPLGIIETLGSIISLGTFKKVADVCTHLKKFLKEYVRD